MRRAALCLLAAAVFAASSAPAQPAPPSDAGPPAVDPRTSEAQQARDLVGRFLELVRQKRWPEVKRLVHPATLKAIAERKQRAGREDHPLAVWAIEEPAGAPRAFRIVEARPTGGGTVVVDVTEDGAASAFLVGKKNAQLFVVDKKRGDTFSRESVRGGYKNYFDRVPTAHDEED